VQDRRGCWLKGCAVLFILVLVSIIIAMLISGGSSDDGPGTATESAPAPAATSAPAAEECPDAAERIYFLQSADLTATLAESFGKFGVLFGEAGEDPALILTERWQLDVAAEMISLELVADGLRDMEPPPGAGEIHTVLQRMPVKLDAVVESITNGLDNLDADELQRGTTILSQLTEDIVEAGELALTYCD